MKSRMRLPCRSEFPFARAARASAHKGFLGPAKDITIVLARRPGRWSIVMRTSIMHAATITPCDAAVLIRHATALIFDVDGTLAETEELHRQAFNHAFLHHGLDWHWDRAAYKELLRVTGGKERIRAYHERLPIAPPLSDEDIAALHRIKTAHYAESVETGCCPLRPGVAELLSAARARGQRLAIATTTSHGNID